MKSLVTISIVRDEADLIEAWVRRHAPMALRMIITLHRSHDGTARILRRLRREGFPLDLRTSRVRHYPQEELTNAMLREAAAVPGVAWILPLDADEFLAADGGAIEPALATLPTDMPVLIPWRTYVPDPSDNPSETHVLRRITHRRDREEPPFGKVLVPRALALDPEAVLPLGNHTLRRRQDNAEIPVFTAHALFLAHVPVRTEAQLRRKVVRGWKSYCRTPNRKPRQIFQWEMLSTRASDPRPMTPEELRDIALRYSVPQDYRTPVPVEDPVPGPHELPASASGRVARLLRPRLPVRVVLAGNENYAVGLAVTVRSALETLSTRHRLDVTVLDGGITDATQRKLRDSWIGFGARVRFLRPDAERVAHLPLTQGMQPATYFRLLLPELLPRVPRVLYLDCDLLVRADLSLLWSADLQGRAVGAVADLFSPTLASIPHHREVGLDPAAPYCSCGVLVLDLDRWRAENLGRRTIDFTAAHPECIRWWDQDGLNAVLGGAWTPLDPHWNVTVEAARLYGWTPPAGEDRRFDQLAADARITHFVTRYKPWKYASPHPGTADFLAVLDRTAWAGWRPDPSTRIPFPPEHLA